MHISYSTQSVVSFLTKSSWPAFIAFMVVLASLLILQFLGAEDVDPEEPPVVRPGIPFVGHMIGLLRHHNNYFTLLRYVRCAINISHCANVSLENITPDQYILLNYFPPESTSFNRLSLRTLLSVKARRLTSRPSKGMLVVKQWHLVSMRQT